jgi:hypothetical protein
MQMRYRCNLACDLASGASHDIGAALMQCDLPTHYLSFSVWERSIGARRDVKQARQSNVTPEGARQRPAIPAMCPVTLSRSSHCPDKSHASSVGWENRLFSINAINILDNPAQFYSDHAWRSDDVGLRRSRGTKKNQRAGKQKKNR